jgi:hypothetical protein
MRNSAPTGGAATVGSVTDDPRRALERHQRVSAQAGVADVMIDYVLAHGHSYQASKRPKGERKRKDGSCFEAAFRYVLRHPDHVYVEGFGMGPNGPPIHHAWAATPSGVVVDLVWPNPEECTYFGVPFTAEEMTKDTKAKGLCTVLARAMARGE